MLPWCTQKAYILIIFSYVITLTNFVRVSHSKFEFDQNIHYNILGQVMVAHTIHLVHTTRTYNWYMQLGHITTSYNKYIQVVSSTYNYIVPTEYLV